MPDGASLAPAVTFQGVSKIFGAVAAVDDLSFDIAPGTLVTLLGPSGCGKTSTLRLVAGLEHPSAGRIAIGGQDVTHRSAAERDVSMVFQSYALFPHMTVLDNVCYGLRASGVRRARASEMAAAKLGSVGLAGFERRLPSELSGGQQQRVAVARAIVLEPKVLLFDEPLSNLDAKLRRQVRDDIRALQQALRLTVVYVTHDQEEALAVSDRIVVMRGGRIVQDGAPRDLYERPADRFIADFIGDANLIAVSIEPTPDGMARVALGTLTLSLPSRGLRSGPAMLAVRPGGVRIHAGAPGPDELPGRIVKSAYLGSHMEYGVTIDGIANDVFVVDPGVADPFPPGALVAVSLARGAVALVAA